MTSPEYHHYMYPLPVPIFLVLVLHFNAKIYFISFPRGIYIGVKRVQNTLYLGSHIHTVHVLFTVVYTAEDVMAEVVAAFSYS